MERDKQELEQLIQDLQKEIGELENNLIHDPLTGLKTRAFFEEEVSTFLEVIMQQSEATRYGGTQRKERFGFRNLSILFFDLDHFKSVNDTHGHDAGDQVLIDVSRAIQSCLRTGDTVARWGGEEIVASLLGANEKDAATKAEEIRGVVEKLNFSNLPNLKITISIGVTASEKGLKLPELIKRADQALYQAKSNGRNRVATYSELP